MGNNNATAWKEGKKLTFFNKAWPISGNGTGNKATQEQQKLNKGKKSLSFKNVQNVLEGVGMTPTPMGVGADIANSALSLGGGIYSLAKGDVGSAKEHGTMALLHGASSFPIFGKVAEAFKLGRRGKKLAQQHFKSTKNTTVPVRGGKAINDPLGEYNNLVSMNRIAPNNVVKPSNIKVDKLGNFTGFNMEKIDGTSLFDLQKQGGKFTKKMQEELSKVIKKLNNKGYYHGDLNAHNIIIRNGVPVIIDPTGVGHASKISKELLKDVSLRDTNAVSNLVDFFKK